MSGTEMFGVISVRNERRASDVIKPLIEEFSGEEVWRYVSFEGPSARFYGNAPEYMWTVLPRLLEELRRRRLLDFTYVFIVDEEERGECLLYEGSKMKLTRTKSKF